MVKELTRKMKDSGIEWIGEIPEDWELVRISSIVKERSDKVSSIDYEPLSVTKQGVVPQLEGVAKSNNPNDRKKVIKGDFVINSRSDRKQSCGIAPVDGSVSLINIILELKRILPEYTKYLLDNYGFAEEFYRWGTGIVDDLWSTNYEKMKRIIIPLPPQSQQKSIADFLDKKTEEIDNIISKTKKAIEEYKKYKQSLITETVTKGLDKNVEMKDSVIEWIGEIPEDWNTIKFKDLFKFGSGLTITKSDLLDEGIKVINYGEIHSKYKFDLDINRDELKCVDKSYLENRKNALINKGDFVFCDTSEDREGSGNCIVLRENNDELIFAGSHTVTARLIRNENPIYIRYMIMASSVKEQISSTVVGIKVYSITQAILKTIIGVLPPLKDQEEIANYLDKKCSQIDNIISTKEKLLTEMEAYKKSLIYETVTGKREVE